MQAAKEQLFGKAVSKKDDERNWNANRNVTRTLNRAGMAIEVKRDTLTYEVEDGTVLEVPYVKPSSWLSLVLKKYRTLLFPHGNIEQELDAFWSCYKNFQPGHVVFEFSAEKLKRTLPILLHGDEGRYLKKGNYMITTIELMLGSSPTKKKTCSCEADPALSRYPGVRSINDSLPAAMSQVASNQLVNSSGNCFLSKFLLLGLQSQLYKKHPDLVHQALDLIAQDLTLLHKDGVEVGSERFYCGVLGEKGDLKFHYQVGNLVRTYLNTGTKNERAICSLCLAGSPEVPFEELGPPTPAWEATMFQEKPWDDEPSLVRIPFEPGREESLFRLDTFHCWKVGVGRDLVGSTVITLALLEYFDFEPNDPKNLPERLLRCHSSFKLWCLATGKSPALHYFSQALFNCSNQRQFPWVNVKGSDCMLMTSWLVFVVKTTMQNNLVKLDHSQFFQVLLETLESVEVFFKLLYSHGLWLPPVCAQRALHHVTVMLRGYKWLSQEARRLNIVAYSLKPKLHAMRHIAGDIEKQLSRSSSQILNPLAFSCEANEDMVGHVARLSRRVSARTVNHRVFDRVCIRMKTLWRRKRKHSEI